MFTSEIRVGKLKTQVWAFSPEDSGVPDFPAGWSLSHFTWGYRTALQHAHFSALSKRLRQVFKETGVVEMTKVYAPHVGPASARIADGNVLDSIRTVDNATLYWSPIPIDGVIIEPGDAFAMCAAGCGLIIASGIAAGGHRDRPKHMIVAHAGRDSLVEKAALYGRAKREHVSVVFAVVHAFGKLGIKPKDITMHMLFAIPPHERQYDYPDAELQKYNRAFANYVGERWLASICQVRGGFVVDIQMLFALQARQAGIGNVIVSNSLTEHRELTHTYDGRDPRRRNLILVKRLT